MPVRHEMVRLHPASWAGVLAERGDLAALPLLADWAERGWPLVARRRGAADPDGAIALGLPLPPALGKRRVAVAVPPSAIVGIDPPPPLAGVAVPAAWRATRDALVALGRRCDALPRAFGSFAWTELTGLDYLAATSDLDLLWPLGEGTPTLLAALAAIEARAPGRIDGEVIGRGGSGVQWRELEAGLAGGSEVLVKTSNGVALIDAAAFLRGDAA